LSSIGFINKLIFQYRANDSVIISPKGGFVFGFNNGENTYGFLINDDEIIATNLSATVNYILCSETGIIQCVNGVSTNLRGIGANISGIPWYTYPGPDNQLWALVGKIFANNAGIMGGMVSCDDAFWCEFEGTFQ
jgi:hypothetical protein